MLRTRCVKPLMRSLVLLSTLLPLAGGVRAAEARPRAPFQVDARVALASFATIADAHLQQMARSLEILAASEQGRSADWKHIEAPLRHLGEQEATALSWFALPDGSYWSVQNGREQGNLSTRPYFRRVLTGGQPAIGDLVVSKATAQNVVIVAVPVKGRDGSVAGVLGASIYLEKLSQRIRQQMALTGDLIFYAFDATPLLALVWDPGLIFTNPKELGPEVDRAFTEMLTRSEGVVKYTFRGKRRTVVFQKSSACNWWYALGRVEDASPGT